MNDEDFLTEKDLNDRIAGATILSEVRSTLKAKGIKDPEAVKNTLEYMKDNSVWDPEEAANSLFASDQPIANLSEPQARKTPTNTTDLASRLGEMLSNSPTQTQETYADSSPLDDLAHKLTKYITPDHD